MGKCSPKYNWVCFVYYLKIINTFLNSNVSIMKQIVWEIQNGTEIFLGQAVFELLIKIYFAFDQ